MGQDLLYAVMPRINFTPSQLAYNRRVSKSDRSQTRAKDCPDHEDNFGDLYEKTALLKKQSMHKDAAAPFTGIDTNA